MSSTMNMQVLAQVGQPEASKAVGIFAGLGIIFVLIAAVTTIFWIWMLIDCATNTAIDGSQKVVWILIILFLHALGALIYLIAGRAARPRGAGP